jgi:hypothetical protein
MHLKDDAQMMFLCEKHMDFPWISHGFHLTILEPNTPLRPTERGISWIPWKHSWQTPGTRCPGFGQHRNLIYKWRFLMGFVGKIKEKHL